MLFTSWDVRRFRSLSYRIGSKSRQAIADLIREPRIKGEYVSFSGSSGFSVMRPRSDGTYMNAVRLRGAYRSLMNTVWSTKDPPKSSPSKGRQRGALRFNNGKTYSGRSSGLDRGKDVHEQIAAFATCEKGEFHARYPLVDPLTRLALKRLKNMSLVPVHAEYIVYDAEARVGTPVDVVCINEKDGSLWFVEVKTGYRDAFVKEFATFRGPLRDVPDSILNRARTQLLLACGLYRKAHNVTPKCLVIQVEGVEECTANTFDMGPLKYTQRRVDALLSSITVKNKIASRKRKRPQQRPIPKNHKRTKMAHPS